MKTPKASGALRRAPDPMPIYARFAHLTRLCYVGKIGRTRAGAPLDQILHPLLHTQWADVFASKASQMLHRDVIV